MQSSIVDTTTKSEFICALVLFFVVVHMSKFYYNVTLLGCIGIYRFLLKRKKKSFSVRKKVSISHRKHSTIVSETAAGNLINWLCVECGLKRMNLNFYDIKYRWATLKTSIPTKTVLPRTSSMIHCRLDLNNCLPHYTTTKNVAIKVETDATCVICRVFSNWWKGKSMNPDVVSRWRTGENGSNLADFFFQFNKSVIDWRPSSIYDITMFVRRNKWIQFIPYHFLSTSGFPFGRVKIICMTWQRYE